MGNLERALYETREVFTIAEMEALTAIDNDSCFVRDVKRGGLFIYDSTEVGNNDQGLNFSGWIRQYEGDILDSWFGAIGDGVADDTNAFLAMSGVASAIKLTGTSYNLTQTIEGSFYHDKTSSLSYTGSGKFATLGINQPSTPQVFAQNGAIINRFGDKVLIGGAVESDASFPNDTKDWMSQYQVDAGLSSGSPLSSNLVSLSSDTGASSIGGVIGAKSNSVSGANQSTIGVFGIAVNNHPTLATRAWGGYFEAHKDTPTGTGCRGIEVDVRVVSGTPEIDPTPAQQTFTSCLQLGAGAELSAVGQQNVGACIQVVPNPMQFRKGIVFNKDSLEGTDGTSGTGVAVAMASYHALDWYNNSNVRVGRIKAQTTSGGGQIQFTSTGISLIGSNGGVGCSIADVASAVNSVQIISSATGNPVQVSAGGTDTDVDLKLTTKGAGKIRMGTYSAVPLTISGYIEIKDSAGVLRKLAVVE